MAELVTFDFKDLDLEALGSATGRVAVVASPEGTLDKAGRRIARLTRGALKRLVESERFEKAKEGDVLTLVWGEPESTQKTSAEKHKQAEIRVRVSPTPYAREARENYADSWRTKSKV